MAARTSDTCKSCGGEGGVAFRSVELVRKAPKGEEQPRTLEEVETFYRCRRDSSHEWWTKSHREPEQEEAPVAAATPKAAQRARR